MRAKRKGEENRRKLRRGVGRARVIKWRAKRGNRSHGKERVRRGK